MNANELTFGVEFEVTLPMGIIPVGSYFQGIQIDGLPAGWVAKHDSSIVAESGRMGAEIVSPVLKGADGARQLQLVGDWLHRVGATVNRSTGMHVHVGWTGDDAALARLAHLASNHEKAFFASTGTKARERGIYCQPVRSSAEFVSRFVNARDLLRPSRYHLLNITNVGNPSKQTVEFRCFAGTTNYLKIVAYVRMALGLVEKALVGARKTTWANKPAVATSPIHRAGEGQTELTRLFYALGWTKGRVADVFGNLASEELPSLKEVKRELMRLAKKYDEQQ